jgi:hypothetical protein
LCWSQNRRAVTVVQHSIGLRAEIASAVVRRNPEDR